MFKKLRIENLIQGLPQVWIIIIKVVVRWLNKKKIYLKIYIFTKFKIHS